MKVKVLVPTSFIQDAYEGMEDQARGDSGRAFCDLLSRIDNADVKKVGRGSVLVLLLRSEDELNALQSEAEYKAEYWGTDAYGVDYKNHALAAAAKKVVQRCTEARAWWNGTGTKNYGWHS